MNDFLRTCNCVNPSEQDCENCVKEVAVKKPLHACCGGKCSRKDGPTTCASGH